MCVPLKNSDKFRSIYRAELLPRSGWYVLCLCIIGRISFSKYPNPFYQEKKILHVKAMHYSFFFAKDRTSIKDLLFCMDFTWIEGDGNFLEIYK